MNQNAPPFYFVSLKKLVIMTIATFGFFILYWNVTNWQRQKRNTGEKINVVWRGIFAIFYIPSLFSRIANAAQNKGLKFGINTFLLSLLFIIANLVMIFGNIASYGTISPASYEGMILFLFIWLLPLLILIYVQSNINKIAKLDGFTIANKFTKWDWAAILLFIALSVLSFIPIATVTVNS